MGLVAGDAFDLTNGWDFNMKGHRDAAKRKIEEQKPLLLIGSPPCTPFCRLQHFSPDSKAKKGQTDRRGCTHEIRGRVVSHANHSGSRVPTRTTCACDTMGVARD